MVCSIHKLAINEEDSIRYLRGATRRGNGRIKTGADRRALRPDDPLVVALFRAAAGGLIMAGTPEGVGAVVQGDLMTGDIDCLGEIKVRVV